MSRIIIPVTNRNTSQTNAPSFSSSSASTLDDDDDAAQGLRGASGKGYLWEESYKRTWDVLQEDEDGSLSSVIASIAMQKRKRYILFTYVLF